MSSPTSGSKKRDFNKILEQGASVDSIFKDDPVPKGSDPFYLENEKDASKNKAEVIGSEFKEVPLELGAADDTNSFLVASRKLSAVEALFKLIGRDYYSFGQLISEILRITMEHVRSESGSFLEIDHQGKYLFFRAVTGRSSEGLLNFTVPMGQGVVGFVCDTQQPMTLSSVDDSSVYLKSISTAIGFEAKNLVAYPIVIRGVTFGCIEVLNRVGEDQYTDEDKEVMATIAECAAKVIEVRLMLSTLTQALNPELVKKDNSNDDGQEVA